MVTTIVNTVAGTGNAGFNGDGYTATSAYLYQPGQLCFDAIGGYYIADTYNHRIRYVSASGIMTTFAGTGGAAYNQDFLAPTASNIYYPESVKLDNLGNVYIADTSNYRIRGVFSVVPTAVPTRSPTATLSTLNVQTIVGNGAGNYPIDNTPALQNSAGYIRDMVFDSSNNLYYTDGRTYTIRVVYAATGLQGTFAGNYRNQGNSGNGAAATSCYFGTPFGINFDSTGAFMYVTDVTYHTVRKIAMSTQIISLVAGTGNAGYNFDSYPAAAATMNSPYNAITDLTGQVYVSDFSNYRIRLIKTNNYMYTFAGTGGAGSSVDGLQATATYLYNPARVTFDNTYSFLYVPEWSAAKVRKISMTTGICYTVAGNGNGGFGGDGGVAYNAYINVPVKVVFDKTGGFYITDRNNHRIRYVTSQGLISTYAGTGSANFIQDNLSPLVTPLNTPESVCLDANGFVVINDQGNQRIRGVYALSPSAAPTFFPTVAATATYIETIAGTPGNNGYPVDGQPARTTSTGAVRDLLFDTSGNLYYAELNTYTVRVIYAATGLSYTFAGNYRVQGNTGFNSLATSSVIGVTSSTSLCAPYGLAWDSSGNMLVADQSCHVVRLVQSLLSNCLITLILILSTSYL